MNFKTILLIGIGGGIGSITRFICYKYMHEAYPGPFPWGTFLVNISGCLFIGVLYALAEKGNILSPEWRLFLMTGFCGGFTTFSAFALENVNLLKAGDFMNFSLYTAGSVILGLSATWLGITMGKLI